MKCFKSIRLISILFAGLTVLSGATLTGSGENGDLTIRDDGLPDDAVRLAKP